MTAVRRRSSMALALLALSSLITSLDFTIVYVALPDIAQEVGFSGNSTQWVVSAYAIFFGGFLLLGGRSADLLGRRRMFVLGMLLFGGASLLGGLATAPGMLIAARVLQGMGGAVLFPATLSLVTTSFAEGRDRVRALAIWAGAGAGGLSLGALLGGVLTSAFGWSAVFLVNVPLVLVGAALAFLVLAPDGPAQRGGIDLPGALTGTAGATLLVFAISRGPETGWTRLPVPAAAAAAIVLLAAFLWIEARSAGPLMPLRLFRNRSLSSAQMVIFVFGGSMQNIVYFLTQYFQGVLGYSALQAGLAFLSLSVVIGIANFVAERLVVHLGPRRTLIIALLFGSAGGALVAAGMLADGSYLTVLGGIGVYGLGMGFIYPTMFGAAGTGVAEGDQGTASGMANTALQIGTATGLAVLVGAYTSGLDGKTGEALRVATADGLRTVAFMAAGLTLLGLLAAVRIPAAGQPGPLPERARKEFVSQR